MTRPLRLLLASLVVLPAWLMAASQDAAFACEMCRRFGSTAYHVDVLGGDDHGDALQVPLDPEEENTGGSGSYVPQGGKWPQPGGLGTPVTVTYSFNNVLNGELLSPNGQPLSRNLIRHSIEEALGLWASVAPLHFVEVPDSGRSPVTLSQYLDGDGKYGKIRFNHLYYNGPDPAVGQPVAKALAYFPSTGGNIAGDVFFDNGDRWRNVGTLTQPDILGAAVHEIGHTLGLGHSYAEQSGAFWHWSVYNQFGQIVDYSTPKGAAVMFWIFERFSGLGTGYLFQDDIAGIRWVYGAGVGSVTPLPYTIPEPASWVLTTLAALGWMAMARVRKQGRRTAVG